MSLYELNDEQVKNLKIIIGDANIKGAAARAILEIEVALSKPVLPTPKEPVLPPAPKEPKSDEFSKNPSDVPVGKPEKKKKA